MASPPRPMRRSSFMSASWRGGAICPDRLSELRRIAPAGMPTRASRLASRGDQFPRCREEAFGREYAPYAFSHPGRDRAMTRFLSTPVPQIARRQTAKPPRGPSETGVREGGGRSRGFPPSLDRKLVPQRRWGPMERLFPFLPGRSCKSAFVLPLRKLLPGPFGPWRSSTPRVAPQELGCRSSRSRVRGSARSRHSASVQLARIDEGERFAALMTSKISSDSWSRCAFGKLRSGSGRSCCRLRRTRGTGARRGYPSRTAPFRGRNESRRTEGLASAGRARSGSRGDPDRNGEHAAVSPGRKIDDAVSGAERMLLLDDGVENDRRLRRCRMMKMAISFRVA